LQTSTSSLAHLAATCCAHSLTDARLARSHRTELTAGAALLLLLLLLLLAAACRRSHAAVALLSSLNAGESWYKG
jgi:hypothetical protein